MQKTFHPECFVCAYCGKIFANSPFYLEDGLPYCEEGKNKSFDYNYMQRLVQLHITKLTKNIQIYVSIHFYLSDWNELFTTKCVSCGFPIEAGDRWVEALNNNYHSQCFNCTVSLLLIF